MFPQHHESPFEGYIDSCGHEERDGIYVWDGLKRGLAGEYVVIQYTIAGEGRLRFKKKHYRLTPGTAMLIFMPHDHKYWLPAQQKTWRFLFVCLTGAHIVKIWKWLVEQTGPVVDLLPDSKPIALLSEICLRAARSGFEDEYLAADFAHRLVFSLCETLLPNIPPDDLPAALRLAEEYCKGKLHLDLGVNDIAKAANVSINQLTKLFRQHRNTTPREYLEQARMEKACFLLASTNLPVSDLSKKCGFRDGNYFAKVFRRIFKTAPSEYRAQRC